MTNFFLREENELFRIFTFKCYSLALFKKEKHILLDSNKGIFPPSTLNRLKIQLYNSDHPIFFEITSPHFDRKPKPKKKNTLWSWRIYRRGRNRLLTRVGYDKWTY